MMSHTGIPLEPLHGPYVLGALRNQQKNQKPKYFISFEMYFISLDILFNVL